MRSPRPRGVGGPHWERLIRAEMRPPSPLARSSLGPVLGGAAARSGRHCASKGLTREYKVSCAALRPALSHMPGLGHLLAFLLTWRASCFFKNILKGKEKKKTLKTQIPCYTRPSVGFGDLNTAHLQFRKPIGNRAQGWVRKTLGMLRPPAQATRTVVRVRMPAECRLAALHFIPRWASRLCVGQAQLPSIAAAGESDIKYLRRNIRAVACTKQVSSR